MGGIILKGKPDDTVSDEIPVGVIPNDAMPLVLFVGASVFVDIDGNVLGFHEGIINYTIGQRRGINIAFGERKFVVKIDAKNNS